MTHLLDKANGQVDVVKQLLAEKENQKHHEKSPAIATNGDDEKISFSKKQHEIDADDLDNLRQLRSAGVHGNPAKILTVFHECNGSIEKTIARLEKEREQREQQSKKREQVNKSYPNINYS